MNTVLTLALVILAFAPAAPKDKKSFFANYISTARYIAVVPLQGKDSAAQSTDDRLAASAVEQELRKWKRFQIVSDPSAADLIIAVRRGRIADAKLGTGGRFSAATGPGEDLFEVYQTKTSPPLDAAPIWMLHEADCLATPAVRAVFAFRKAVENAEKP